MSQAIHYYDLTGQPARIEDLLSAPFEYGREKISECIEGGDYLIGRIASFAVMFFLCVITSPLYGCATAINYYYHQKIDSAHYAQEFKLWQQRFHHYGDDPLAGLNDISQRLIKLLITSGKKAENCRFEHILCVDFNPHLQLNILAPDGKFGLFPRYFREAEKCVIIGCPTRSFFTSQIEHGLMTFQQNNVKEPMSSLFKKRLFVDVKGDPEMAKSFQKVACLWTKPLGSKVASEIVTALFV